MAISRTWRRPPSICARRAELRKLSEFAAWCQKHITGDEKGQAQIFLDRLFQAFGQPGSLDVGGTAEFRIRKADEDGGGTAFADYVWKPVVLIEMKKRGTDLQKHYRQAFDYWTRLVPNRPRYVVLCNFDEFRVYDFDTDCELDEALIESLHATLHGCQQECERAGVRFSATVLNEDFIAAAVPMVRGDLFASHQPRFNAAIVNPPYRKIRSDSSTRLLLRSAGIETGNLYTGFVALITKLLADRGELVAITPRSFCNGPYFKPFRTDFLETMSLRRLHVFESRSAAFSRDDVLQENIILHAVKGAAKPEQVIISSSSGASGSSVTEREVAYREVVSPDDAEQFIHLAEGDAQDSARAVMGRLSASLPDLGLSVSTGRVVDFRAKEFLRQQPERDTAPLIYPCHFNGGFVHWPKEKARKPNAIVSNEQTRACEVLKQMLQVG